MVNFFIRRPIFATVSALLMLLIGGICAFLLPIAQYPQIAPPQVQVTTTYTGADALSVARTVTTPIEQQINGTKGMIYFSSDSTSNGVSNIVATFDVGYSQDMAAVDIQNKVQTAQAAAPARGQAVRRDDQEDVDRHGLRRQPDLARRPLRRQLPRQLRPDLRRRRRSSGSTGVSDVNVFGRKYAMRIWIDPDRLANMRIAPTRGDPGDPAGEPPGRRRQDRRPAGARRAGLRVPDHRQGAAGEGGRVRGDHRPPQRRRLDRPRSRTSPASSSRRRTSRRPATSTASPPAAS